MRYYFFLNNKNEQRGPFTLDELQEERILNSSLVWKEGLPDWKQAHELDELKGILISPPPPIPNYKINEEMSNVSDGFINPDHKNNNERYKEKKHPIYDENYVKEDVATSAGIIVIAIYILTAVILNINPPEDSEQYRIFAAIVNLIWRIIATIWVIAIAGRQNRQTGLWGLFAFFLPNPCLIIIGQKRKLYNPDELIVKESNNNNNNIEQSVFKYTKTYERPEYTLVIKQKNRDFRTGDFVTYENNIVPPDGKYRINFIYSIILKDGEIIEIT